jgi:hypothetical protein
MSYLKNLVRQSAKDPNMTVAELAAKVLQELPEDKYHEALQEALPLFVRNVLMETRPSADQLPRPLGRGASDPVSSPLHVPFRQPVTHSHPVPKSPAARTPLAPAGAHAQSRPRTTGLSGGARIRDGWQKILDSDVVGAGGRRKKLRECTRADIDALAERLDKQAADTAERARGYRELARRMDEYGVTTIDDFDAVTKMQLFGRKL